jgi:hypothetical protein
MSLSIFLVWKTPGARRLFATSKVFTTLYGHLRGWSKGGVYLSSSVLQVMGATLFGNRGVRPQPLYQKLAKAKPYSLKTVFVKLRDLSSNW